VTTFDKPDQAPVTSFQYRNVGSNIECTAEALEGGRFELQINAEDSSLGETRSIGASTAPDKQAKLPMFLTRNIHGTVVMRDGETVPMYSATDGATGEVTKLDVTLNVLK